MYTRRPRTPPTGTIHGSPPPAGNPTVESPGFQTPSLNPGGQHDWVKGHFNPKKGILRGTAPALGRRSPQVPRGIA